MEKLSNQTIKMLFNELKDDIKGIREYIENNSKEIDALKLWKSYVSGAMAVIILLLVPVVLQYIKEVAEAYFK